MRRDYVQRLSKPSVAGKERAFREAADEDFSRLLDGMAI